MVGSRMYARGLRLAAIAVAVLALGRQLAGGPFPPGTELQLAAVRLATAAVAVLVAVLATGSRDIPAIRRLAFLLGIGASVGTLGVVLVTPAALWEQGAVLVAILFGAALFIPWSWRWQASLAGVVFFGAVAALAWLGPAGEVPGATAVRVAFTLAVLGAASVAGARLVDNERRRVAASEARYRTTFEHAGDPMAVIDPDRRVREANPRLLDLLGRTPEDVLGRRLREFYVPGAEGNPKPGDPPSQVFQEVMLGHVRRATRLLTRGDGPTVEAEITFARAEGPAGPLILAIFRDLTERRAEERQRGREQRLESLTRLAGGFAHQFNNLLGGILTHASVLREDPAYAAARGELDQVLAAARRGGDLTKELLRFSRHAPIALRPTTVGEVVRSVAELARTTLPEDTVVDVQTAPDVPAMTADPDHLIHACLEVLLNARDAIGRQPGGRLTIAAAAETVRAHDRQWPDTAPGRYVRLSISDTGAGMDAATLERVFEPFFTTKPMHQAPGLGLAQVYRIVRDHHGTVRIDSAPRRGTTVHILIPVSAEQPQPAPTPAPAPAAPAPA
ncbi:MAG: ATP-binding protein, partial [Gemmatimonadales bacterium]